MPAIMAILNVTPDSFYAVSRAWRPEEAIARALLLQEQGADILDIGGESTRPGAVPLSAQEELARVLPVLKGLKGKLHIPISIDTMKPEVARAAIQEGARLINDVSGFQHPEMRKLAQQTDVDLCVMHMQGTPATMQDNPQYEAGVVSTSVAWLRAQCEHLMHLGIAPQRLIVDPGIGFGKSVGDNLAILHQIQQYKKLGFRLLVGISRKSFLSKLLQRKTDDLLPATLAANCFLALRGVDIIRVHDVQAHKEAFTILEEISRDS